MILDIKYVIGNKNIAVLILYNTSIFIIGI